MDVNDTDDSPDEIVLSLRRGRRRDDATEPDVTAFSGGPPVAPRPDAVGVAGGGRIDPNVLTVYFERAAYPIPAPSPTVASLDTAAFVVAQTRFGYVAAVPRVSPGRTFARAHWVIAACLPLALLPTLAEAAPAASGRRARKTDAVETPAKAETQDEGAPASETDAEGPDAEGGDDGASPGEDMIVEPRPSRPLPAPPPVDDVMCPDPGPVSTQDAAWEGVKGYDVELVLTDDREVTGRVTAVQKDTFTLVDLDSGGVVRVIQKRGVKRMRVQVYETTPSTRDGTGLLVGGGLLTAVGAPVFLTGAVFLGICPSCTYLHIPMLMVGGGALGAAIPMLVRGARRRRAYNDNRSRATISGPSVSFTRHGWTGGLRLRF